MKLSEFILSNMEQILSEWSDYAQTMSPAADTMSLQELRDHAEQMLRVIAADIEHGQTAQQAVDKSEGLNDPSAPSAASDHGALRQASHFTLVQLSSEFRALRAAVLRGWLPVADLGLPETLDAVVRFNEAIDQALAESIVAYSARTDQARELFVAVLGHDLRGPLATMSLAGDLLSRAGGLGAPIDEVGPRIKRAARFMTSMVEDMLGFARAKLGGGMPIARQPVDVGEAVAAAVADAEAMHPACNYRLEMQGDLAGSHDPIRLHQLLVNLLGNAGQHGAPDQPVNVSVRGDSDAVWIEIRNQGTVIPANALERIFDPLVQLGSDGESPAPGASLGLGLFIAREIANGHGGSLTATSDASGTAFTVCLPRQPAESTHA